MKKCILPFLFLLFTQMSLAQRICTLPNAEKEGIGITKLDSLYKSALHSEPDKAVFSTQQENFTQAYFGMVKEMATFLRNNGLELKEPLKGFHKVYFSKKGHIEYYLFVLKGENANEELHNRFAELMQEFCKNYKFPLKAKEAFAQCCPFTLLIQ